MSLGEVHAPDVWFGKIDRDTRKRAERRALIVRVVDARRVLEANAEVTAQTLLKAHIRALRLVCMNGSPLAEDCDVALGLLVLDEGDPEDNISMAVDRVVDAINARVNSDVEV